MAKGNSGGNKYARRLKNPELMGKGDKQTQEQILAKGPKPSIEQKIQEIKSKQPDRSKDH